MELRLLTVFVILSCCCSRLILGQFQRFNWTSSSLGMYRDMPLKVAIPFSAEISCSGIQLRIVSKTQYENCEPFESNSLIGHCDSMSNVVYLNIHGTGLQGSLDYQVGQIYYYAAYGSPGDSTDPCSTNMYKFQLEIVNPEDLLPSSTTIIPEMISSSNNILPSLSSSYLTTNIITSSVDDLIQPSSTSLTKTRPTSSTVKYTEYSTTSTATVSIDPNDKSSTIKIVDLPTNTPTRPTIGGIASEGMNLRTPSLLMTCTLLILALILPLLRRTL